MSSYNRVNIQKMLMGCFGDDDLIQFAFSYVPSFEHKIGSGIGKQELEITDKLPGTCALLITLYF